MDSAVNINFPSSRQPAAAPPRLSASAPLRAPPTALLALPPALRLLRSSGPPPTFTHQPRRAAPAQPPEPQPASPRAPPGSSPAASGKPKAQARQGLKETGPPLPHNGFEQVRGRVGRTRKGEADRIGPWRTGAGKSLSARLFQSTAPRRDKLLTS